MLLHRLYDRLLRAVAAVPGWLVLYWALCVMAWLIFARAWVAEDAYISFRVIDNALAGNGLRWNLHERVQVYTHPLWLLMQIPLAAVWPNLFQATIALSIACSMAALCLVVVSARQPLHRTLLLFLLPVALSKSVMDYSTSGLETPLCYLTFACFGWVVLRLREHRYFWFFCSLSVALALTNRLDTAIIFAPALIWLMHQDRDRIRWHQLWLGALPLLAWLAFSVFYYGFPFPNTKLAKLDTGLPLTLYLKQSLNYVQHLVIFDLAGFLILCSSLWFIFRSDPLPRWIALGVYFYTLYVLYIGGDYMAGRFWAFPIFVSIWLWYTHAPKLRADLIFATACLLAVSTLASPLLRDMNKNCSNCLDMQGRILDATRTFHLNRLVISRYPLKLRERGQYPFCRDGKKLADRKPPVKVMFFVGMHAYCAGPQLKAIDMLGLGDALIARLPASTERGFYIGHFRRVVPKGYAYAVDTGNLKRMHPSLAQYYEKLRLITAGELWSMERLKTIVLFNLGYYDRWKEEYLYENR